MRMGLDLKVEQGICTVRYNERVSKADPAPNNDMQRSRRSAVLMVALSAARRPADVER